MPHHLLGYLFIRMLKANIIISFTKTYFIFHFFIYLIILVVEGIDEGGIKELSI